MYLFGGLGGCEKDAQVFDGSKWKKLARLPFNSGSGSCSYRNGQVHLGFTLRARPGEQRLARHQNAHHNPRVCAVHRAATAQRCRR